LDLKKKDKKKKFVGLSQKRKKENQIGPTCVVSTWIGMMKNW
jgi:hypothetical protein